MWTLPYRATVTSAATWSSALSETSALTPSTSALVSFRAATALASASSSISHNITFTPACDSAVAMPNPIPNAAPVTNAVFPDRSFMRVSLRFYLARAAIPKANVILASRHVCSGHIATQPASSDSSLYRMSASRQPYREFGEVTDFAIDRDGAAMLLGYDVVTYRQSKPGALAGRLGREERLEQLVPVFRRNADTIVTHPDLDAFAELAGRDLQCRAVSSVALAAPLIGGIEAIAYEIEEYASQLLRHDVNRCELAVEVVLQRDVEVRILRTGPVIGKVQGFLGERVQIGSLPIIAAAS